MKNRIFKTSTVFLIILCICLPPSARTAAEDSGMLSLFNSFSGYTDIDGTKMLPSGVTVRTDYRKSTLSAYYDNSSARYGEAMRVGYHAEPLIPFNKLINSNKLHVSFDIKATDIELRNIYIGFYDGRNGDDPNNFGLEQYSMAMLMDRGKVHAIQANSEKTSNGDMQSWTLNSTAGVTYVADKWYTVDFEFDMDKKTARYYFDGKLLNEKPVGTTNAKGFKSLLFRCEVPKENGKELEGYKEQDAAFIVDNISIDEYSGSYKIGNLKESDIAPDNHTLYLSCADSVETPSKDDVSIKTVGGKAVDFGIGESDGRGFSINIPNLIPDGSYVIDASGIKGTAFNTAGRDNITFNVAGSESCYFSDTFDSYNDETFLQSWTATVPEKAGLSGNEGYNRAANITSVREGTQSGIEHSFAKAITADEFVIEMTVKASGPFDLVFKDINGNSVKVFTYRKGGKFGCYTDGNSKYETPDGLKIDNWGSVYARLKLLVNRKNQTYTVTTPTKSYEFKYNYTLADICGISIMTHNEGGTQIYIDEIYVKAPTGGVYAEFGRDRSVNGAMYYSEGINSKSGQVLRSAQSVGNTNGTEYYNIEKQKGTMVIKTDADSGIECDGTKNIRFEIEYLDNGYGWICAEYDTPSGTKTTAALCMADSGEVKKESFIINDWIKNSNGIACLTLKTYTTVNDGKQAANDRNYSKYPVVIKSIRLTDTETAATVRASISTENSGNIFFENETPKFDISLNNESTAAQNVKCTAEVYEKDKNGGESRIYSTVFDADIDGGGSKNIKLVVPIDKFGLYRLKTEVTGDGIQSEAEAEFSKCATVSTQNYTMGASAHFTRYGDAKVGAELLKKAGMGLVRDDFLWREYEQTKGVYALTERQEKLCDAAVEYDLKLLPIVYGNNKWYDSTQSDFISESAMPDYLKFVKNILSEPKVRAATDMVELWNEPDIKKTRDGKYIAQYADRGSVYGDILKQSAQTIRGIDHNYKIGAFCLSNLISDDAKKFMDMALSQLTDEDDNESEDNNESNDETYFDTIALHPYMAPSVDPEKGRLGANTDKPTDYVGYRINYIKALVTGGEVDNYVTGTKEAPVGITTGKQYGFKLTEPMWHTEYGISTADYAYDGLCVGDEYSQAIWLVRGYNQIKVNNLADKVWFYDFADDGDRINEKEYNFGIMHSYTGNVPYSAKYAYLALAAFNKMTEGAISVREVYNTDYSFITRYHSYDYNRNSYLLWTSKQSEQTISWKFGENVKFYDLLGNEISKESVMKDGKYIVSGEPYWAVVGEEPKYCTSYENKSGLYVIKDGVGMTEVEIPTDGKAFDILADLSGTDGGDRVMVAAAYKDNRLNEIKLYPVDDNVSCQRFNIDFNKTDTDEIKIMLYKSMYSVKPLCVSLEKNLKE